MNSRVVKDRILRGGIIGLSAITVLPLFLIVGTILYKGYKQINWDFFTQTAPSSLDAMLARTSGSILPGGIANGIVGTLLMVLVASLVAIPIGLLGGIFLSEHRRTRFAGVVRFAADLLQGSPSIVIGIIVYIWVVVPMGAYSALAGAVTLGLMMLPPIIRSTEESLNRLPVSLKESALALGCSYPTAILRIMVPAASGGILTGILLSISRVMGETAPLMMTALGSSIVSIELGKPTNAVPLLIWQFYNDPNLVDMVWSSSLFLLLLVLLFNFIAKRISARNK